MADVGAQQGQFSKTFARLRFKVFAFEASPDNFEDLISRMERFSNVTSFHKAVADVDAGRVKFYYSKEYVGINSLLPNSSLLSAHQYEWVESVTLATALGEEAARVKVIKTDIEGADFLALKGFDFKTHKPEIVLSEYGDRSKPFGYQLPEMAAYMEKFGYATWCADFASANARPYSAKTKKKVSVSQNYFGPFAQFENPNWGDAFFVAPEKLEAFTSAARKFDYGAARVVNP